MLDRHRALGARLIDFSGWEMPLQYEGVVSEHNMVRTRAGLFDVSHLGKLRVSGSGAGDSLQRALTADVIALEPGRATYALVLTDEGGCIDDVFVYRIEDDEWWVVPNAANVGAVAAAIVEAGTRPVDEWNRWAILALQGPDSFASFERVFPGTEATRMPLHNWMWLDIGGRRALVARTGYTGERGFELFVEAEWASEVFEALLEAGVAPVGLGARDTLRLEMGYALYGHELALDINPLEARLGWAIAWETPFRGREALSRVKAEGPARRLFGVRCTGRGVPRQGYPVIAGEREIGRATSGNFSPTLKTGIALALGPRELVPEEGTEVALESRGRLIDGVIVKPPFVSKPTR